MGHRAPHLAAVAALTALSFTSQADAEPFIYAEPRAHLVPVDLGKGVHTIPGASLLVGFDYQVEHLPMHIAAGVFLTAGVHSGDAGVAEPIWVVSTAAGASLRFGVEAQVDPDVMMIVADALRCGPAVLDPDGREPSLSTLVSSTLFLGARLFLQGSVNDSSLTVGLVGGPEAYLTRASALGGTAGLHVGFGFDGRDARQQRKN